MHDLDRTLRSQEPELESWEFAQENESPLGELQEMELAAELLSISNEQELDYFFGKIFRKVGGFAKRLAPLTKYLKPLAKRLLPIAGRVAGSFIGGPVGGAIGGKLASMATNLFELEAENFAADELEMEVAKRFVRLASTAAQNFADAPADADPTVTARRALASAAQLHAPGLLRRRENGVHGHSHNAGRWVIQGNRLILLGV
ncbi:MAG: hypothetical protein QOI58_174 [Thermoanaerobaculia bacterium]|jgi:hypothetical protein|nr:hypothetical protein [Thermoanaerobaculia bacterium]